jgi:hypothetical protein
MNKIIDRKKSITESPLERLKVKLRGSGLNFIAAEICSYHTKAAFAQGKCHLKMPSTMALLLLPLWTAWQQKVGNGSIRTVRH